GSAPLDDDDVDARLSRLDPEHAVASAGEASRDIAGRCVVVDHDAEPRPRGQRLEGELRLEEGVGTLLAPEVQLRGRAVVDPLRPRRRIALSHVPPTPTSPRNPRTPSLKRS